jgi:hypothetical protein
MDPLWSEVAKQVPALGVLVFLVVHFLKHIRAITDDFKTTMKEVNETMIEHHTIFRERTEKALDNNTAALARNTTMHEQVINAASKGRFCDNFKAVAHGDNKHG